MSMSATLHLNDDGNAPRVTVHKHVDDGCAVVIHTDPNGYENVTIHGTYTQLENLGHEIINKVAAALNGPLPDPDEDDDEEDEDATQPEPEAVALLPETALVDAKGK